MNAFSEIVRLADDIDAKVMLVYLPHRAFMYYEKATGHPLPDNSFEQVESALLGEFAQKQGIVFVDLSKSFKAYVDGLSNDAPLSEYPYLEIDAHMSNLGHQMVPEAIIERVRSTPE